MLPPGDLVAVGGWHAKQAGHIGLGEAAPLPRPLQGLGIGIGSRAGLHLTLPLVCKRFDARRHRAGGDLVGLAADRLPREVAYRLPSSRRPGAGSKLVGMRQPLCDRELSLLGLTPVRSATPASVGMQSGSFG